jgi:hypothetical protein
LHFLELTNFDKCDIVFRSGDYLIGLHGKGDKTMKLVLELTVVKQYPYRSALIPEPLFTLPRDSMGVTDWEKQIAAAVSTEAQNHVCYEVSIGGEVFHMMFTDDIFIFGKEIKVESW